MTYAQELLEKGRAEGLIEGEQRGEQCSKVEIVEGFLRVGMAWDVIEAATGLTETRFQELKTQLSGADWPHRKVCPQNYAKRHNSVAQLKRGVLAIL